MYTLLLSLFFDAAFGICLMLFMFIADPNTGFREFTAFISFVCLAVSFVMKFVSAYSTLDAVKHQIRTQNCYDQRVAAFAFAKEKCDEMKAAVQKYLGEFYPQYEKDIMDSITKMTPALAMHIPELKTQQSLGHMLEIYSKQLKEVNDYQWRILSDKNEMKTRKSNPWFYSSIIPAMVVNDEDPTIKKIG